MLIVTMLKLIFDIRIFSLNKLLQKLEDNFQNGHFYNEVKKMKMNKKGNRRVPVTDEPAGYRRVLQIIKSLHFLKVIQKPSIDQLINKDLIDTNDWTFNMEKTKLKR